MRLSENFHLSEFTKSKTAIKFGINNQPNYDQEQALRYLVEKGLQPMRSAIGQLHISSGLRVPELNARLGGSLTSYHCLGMASDIDNDGVANAPTNEEVFFYIMHNLPYTELIWEFGNDFNPAWVHYALEQGKEDAKEALIAYKDNEGKTNYVDFSLANLELYLG